MSAQSYNCLHKMKKDILILFIFINCVGSQPEWKTVKVWLNAFIPNNLPSDMTLMGKGASAGHVMVKGPTRLNDCFWTDDRTFSNAPSAPARMHSEAVIDLSTVKMKETHSASPTHEADCEDGDIECEKSASTSK